MNGKKISTPVIVLIFAITLNVSAAASPAPDLKASIDQKNQELQAINSQINSMQNQLDTTRSQKNTLQRELKQINSNLNQLNLGIKSSRVAIEKLGYQIQETQGQISDSESKMREKEQIIMELMRQIQQKDSFNNPLFAILSNRDITQGITEIQGLADFQDKLNFEVSELKALKEDLHRNLNVASNQKTQKEIEGKNMENKKLIAEEVKKYRQDLLTQTKNKEINYQQSLSELQKRQEQIANEIEEMDSAMRGKINKNALPKPGSGVLIMPVQGSISQGYGATNFAKYGGYRGKWHNGLDISAPIGTPVVAAESGKVVAVGNQDVYCYKGAYGKFIVIQHNNNLTTLYAHFSLQVAREGQEVSRGDIIGYVGNTGYSTGPHLHFTVYSSPTFKIGPAKTCGPKMPFGGDLNPANYL